MDFATKLEKLLDVRARQASDLARLLDVYPGRITRWKNGQGLPDLQQSILIAEFFDVSLEWLADPEAVEVPTVEHYRARKACIDVIKRIGPQLAYDRLIGLPFKPIGDTPANHGKKNKGGGSGPPPSPPSPPRGRPGKPS